MKTASAPLTALINAGLFACWNCYTFYLAGGTVIGLTSADFTIYSGGGVWINRPRIEDNQSRPLAHWKIGLDVDQWKVNILPRFYDDATAVAFPDMIGNQPWLAAAASGALRGAKVVIQRAFFAQPPAYPLTVAGSTPVGMLIVFNGLIGAVDISNSEISLTINDYRQLLTTQMPRNVYQPGCRHILFDSGCTLNASSWAGYTTVSSSYSQNVIIAALPVAAGSGTWTLGRVDILTGQNAGQQRMIAYWDGAQLLYLASPLPYPLAYGDGFLIYPGCDKQMGTCNAFGNLVNFGGEPYVPVPETLI